MAGMGLGAAYGAGGAGDAIQEIMKNRLLTAQFNQQQQDIEEHKREAMVREAQSQQTIDQNLHYQQMLDQDRRDRLASEDAGRKETAARGAASLLGVDQPLDPGTAAKFSGTSLAPLVQQNAPLAQPPIAGMMQPDIVPGMAPGQLRFIGTPEQRQAQTQRDQETQLMGDPSLPPTMRAFLRMRQVLPKGENIPPELFKDQNAAFDEFKKKHDYEVAHPLSTPNPQPQMFTGPDGKMHAVQFIGGQAKEVPLPDGFVKPGSLTDKEQHDTAKASGALTQVDQSLDAVKDLVGPAAGRGETVEQWLGSADPKIQAFGTKLLLAKMLVDKTVTGSARAGASPVLLNRWDNLLSNKVSYEGMKAALQAAQDIVGAGSPTASANRKQVRYDADGNKLP